MNVTAAKGLIALAAVAILIAPAQPELSKAILLGITGVIFFSVAMSGLTALGSQTEK